jgi:hypothetical protein
MPTDLPALVLIAVAAPAVAVAVLRRTAQHEAANGLPTSQAHRPGILAGAVDLVDASIGMYMIRRMLGRPTTTRAEGRAERARVALAAAEEAARRASVAGPSVVAPTRLIVAGTAASHSPRELRDRQAHPLAVTPPMPVWRRGSAMSRQGRVVAAGLVGVLVVGFVGAFALWPRPGGGVLSATGTPAPSPTSDVPSSTPISTDSPTPSAPTVEPTSDVIATPSPTTAPTTDATPTPTAVPTATPAATRTPRPTARPTNTPRPTAHPTPTPTATVGPTPTPSPSPTPVATPTPMPTPGPTPAPTPEPTPAPTPEPTPDPTPDPTT